MIRTQPTWYLVVLALVVASLDQFTKSIVVANLELHESWMPVPWLANVVTITHVQNSGAAFGIFPAGSVAFSAIGVVVVGAIVYYFHQLPVGQWWVRTALGFQLGGAIGNLMDRFRLGHVTDFINFSFWPVFNLADTAIVIGVGILIVVMVIEERREARLAKMPESLPDGESDIVGGLEQHDGPAL